ncbi:hypothetical protein C8E83_1341 [Frondihabitans australicus]|uniref:Uncharacterized protein n=1 Tax=Frondihabitans australicus TaxID=386892 RepID=A0A495IE20_9MICO|nr:hypothetical protein C8E83_1341 [Frondihabitans australicus]
MKRVVVVGSGGSSDRLVTLHSRRAAARYLATIAASRSAS